MCQKWSFKSHLLLALCPHHHPFFIYMFTSIKLKPAVFFDVILLFRSWILTNVNMWSWNGKSVFVDFLYYNVRYWIFPIDPFQELQIKRFFLIVVRAYSSDKQRRLSFHSYCQTDRPLSRTHLKLSFLWFLHRDVYNGRICSVKHSTDEYSSCFLQEWGGKWLNFYIIQNK